MSAGGRGSIPGGSRTVIERAGCVDRRDQRNIYRDGWSQSGIMGKSSKALKAASHYRPRLVDGGMHTLTASIHSVRSRAERFLHSRRTLGLWHVVLLATVVDTMRPKNRTRTTSREGRILRGGRLEAIELSMGEDAPAHLLCFRSDSKPISGTVGEHWAAWDRIITGEGNKRSHFNGESRARIAHE